MGHRLAADQPAPVLPPSERPDPCPAGIRPSGQDDLHPAVSGERAVPAPDQHPAQQGGVAALSTGVPVLRQPRQDPAEAGGRAGASGNVLESADQLRDRLEHDLHGCSDRPASHRWASSSRRRSGVSVTLPIRAHQSLRQVYLRGERGPPRGPAPPAPVWAILGLATFCVHLLRDGLLALSRIRLLIS